MSAELIKPEEIPQFTGNADLLESDVTDLRNDAGAISGTGANVHSTFQGLSAFYEAPEAEQLFATTKPVADAGKTFGDDLKTVANALSTYANEVRPLATKLQQLRHDAEAFVADAKKDHDWQYDSHKVDRNNDLRKQVDAAVSAFWDAEIRCANAIDAIFGGTHYVHNDGSNKSNMYGYTADQLDGAKGLPWGDAVDLKYHWYRIDHWAKSFVWDGLIVDGIWGTIKGLGGLVGLEGLDTFLNSWKGLGELAVGLASYSIPFGYAIPDSWLPGWVQDSRKTTRAFGKSLVAWDEWSKDPARAAGGVTFNALTLLAGGEGVAAKAGTVGKVVSVLGKAGKFIDPMTYVAKGAGIALKSVGQLPKVAAALDALKGLKDQAVFNVKGLVNMDALKARFGSLPDGTVPLPDGGHIDASLNYHAPDGTVHEPLHEPSAADRAATSSPDVHVDTPTHLAEVPAERQLVPVGGNSHDLASTTAHDGTHDLGHGGANHEPPNATARTDHTVHNSADGGGHGPGDGSNTHHTPTHTGGDGGGAHHDPAHSGHNQGAGGSDHGPTASHGSVSGHGPGSEVPHGTIESGVSPHTAEHQPFHRGGPAEQKIIAEMRSGKIWPGDSKIKPDDLEKTLSNLADHPNGQEVADIIASGHLTQSRGFTQVVSSMSLKNMMPGAVEQLRLADQLHAQGIHDLSFEVKRSLVTGQPCDMDVLARTHDGATYAYQFKDITNPKKIFQKLTKELWQVGDSEATHRTFVIDTRGTLADLTAQNMPRRLLDYYGDQGVQIIVRVEDGTLWIPPDGDFYPRGAQ